MTAVKELLTKQPFYRLTNAGKDAQRYNKPQRVDQMRWQERPMMGSVMTQTDFLEEFYPFSQRVTSDFYFPEFYSYTKETDDDGKEVIEYHREETFRIGSTFQCVTTVQQLVHVCGNDITHELADKKNPSETEDLFDAFKKGWLTKNMEIYFYQLVESVKMTGDGAVVFFMYNGRLGARRLSFLDGDTLYPHYDPLTGEMELFVRKYSSYDENGKEVVSWVEVWDKEYFTRYRQTTEGFLGLMNKTKGLMGVEPYTMVYRGRHGFSRVPVSYHRDKHNGPCWNIIQGLIDDYTVALSYFAKNNAGAALPAYKMKGDDINIEGDILGRIRAFTMGKDDDVDLLQPKTLSENYTQYVKYLLDEIFRGGFIVKQPELKSGDTPTGTMKLYYAPSLDKAELECKDYQGVITDMRSIFCEGYGIQEKSITQYLRLNERIFSYQVPFIHENTSSLIADLVAAKSAGITSAQTASEHVPYNTNGEYTRRIVAEQKQAQQSDRLFQLKLKSAAAAAAS